MIKQRNDEVLDQPHEVTFCFAVPHLPSFIYTNLPRDLIFNKFKSLLQNFTASDKTDIMLKLTEQQIHKSQASSFQLPIALSETCSRDPERVDT